MKKALLSIIVLLLPFCIKIVEGQAIRFLDPVKSGAFLGMKLPGNEAELFAPGIVSTAFYTRDIAATPDGKEIYFSVSVGNYAISTILVTREIDGKWTKPEVMKHMTDPGFRNIEPCISSDGNRFYFISDRPSRPGSTVKNDDIWMMDRVGKDWSEPYNPGLPLNTDSAEFFPSVTNDGTIYFTRRELKGRNESIMRCRYKDGKYLPAEKLPGQVNSGVARFNACIAPDESFIIIPVYGMKNSLGSTDYYVSFRDKNDNWSDLINLGSAVNTASGEEYSPFITKDMKYFFFMSSKFLPESKYPAQLTYDELKKMNDMPENGNPSIYWISIDVIKKLRPNE